MKTSLLTTIIVLVMAGSAISQQFTLHSSAPFGIDPIVSTNGFPTGQTIQFYDFDEDGDQDLFITALDSVEDLPSIEWENIHFVIEMQENIGTRYAPQFAERKKVSDHFPYPVGYFFAAPGDLNSDGLVDFMTAAHIDFTGNQKLRLVRNTGLPGMEQFEVSTLEAMGLTDFLAESFYMPHLVDLDLDGDLDLFVSGFKAAFAVEDGPDESAIRYARNIGTKTEPNFQGWYPNPYELVPDTVPELMTSGDIDLDGDIDFIGVNLLIPDDSINAILVHLNTPDSTNRPGFGEILDSPFGLPSAFGEQQLISPYLVDIDGDGDLDLFVFRGTSIIHELEYYENNLCQVTTTEIQLSICEGESLQYNGENYTVAGLYEIHLLSSQHCDSIIQLELTVDPVTTSSLEVTICEGASYTIGGDIFTVAGNYVVFVTASNGCDSIIELELTVDPPVIESIAATICEGDAYSLEGVEYTVPGVYTVTVTSASGCDSIIQLSLTVDPPIISSTEATLCAGEAILFEGNIYSEDGVYSVTYIGANGCDSLVTLTLEVRDEVVPEIGSAGHTLFTSPDFALYQWYDCDAGQNIPGAILSTYEVTKTGNYAVIVTSFEGCVGQSECMNVIITATDRPLDNSLISVFPNPALDKVFILNQTGITIGNVTLINTLGQVVLRSEVGVDMEVGISDIKPGAYIVHLSGNGYSGTTRLVIVRE